MAYTDDWENLMNGVFGPGGKLRFDTQKTPPEKPGLPDMNAALLEQQKKLDEMLKKQNAELRRDTTQEALAQSRKMLEDMEPTACWPKEPPKSSRSIWQLRRAGR